MVSGSVPSPNANYLFLFFNIGISLFLVVILYIRKIIYNRIRIVLQSCSIVYYEQFKKFYICTTKNNFFYITELEIAAINVFNFIIKTKQFPQILFIVSNTSIILFFFNLDKILCFFPFFSNTSASALHVAGFLTLSKYVNLFFILFLSWFMQNFIINRFFYPKKVLPIKPDKDIVAIEKPIILKKQ